MSKKPSVNNQNRNLNPADDPIKFQPAGQPHIVLANTKDVFYKKHLCDYIMTSLEATIGGRYILLVCWLYLLLMISKFFLSYNCFEGVIFLSYNFFSYRSNLR